MEKLHIKISKGDAIDSIGIIARIESKIMDGCIQYVDESPQAPENLDFLTAQESFQIVIKNMRKRSQNER